jgi:hypothetical protein
MGTVLIALVITNIMVVGVVGVLFWLLWAEKSRKESEHYTDYVKGNLTIRIYKPELEYNAKKDLSPNSIVEGGHLSPFYDWVLFTNKN